LADEYNKVLERGVGEAAIGPAVGNGVGSSQGVPVGLPVMGDPELLECLRGIGKALIAAGSSVGTVEDTLSEIARSYGSECEIVALPNTLMIKLGRPSALESSVTSEQPEQGGPRAPLLDFTVQRLTYLKLDQMSELMPLIDRVQHRTLAPGAAAKQIDQILAQPHRFGWPLVILGYFLSCVGLTLLYQPLLRSVLVTGAMGVVVGAMVLWFRQRPRFELLVPVIAAFVVSIVIFSLAKSDMIYGAATLIVPPLVTFLPGAVLTTGMIELASMHILSGSARLMYGLATLFLLYMGIGAGLSLSSLPAGELVASTVPSFPWWGPVLGTLLFGIGTFIRLSGANRDLFWMLLVLYIAMVSQTIGERLVTPYFGAFIGAVLMAVGSEVIARSPKRTPALASRALAFWFLVPGARGLLSVTSILGKDFQSAAFGMVEMLGLMGAIALGVLLGTLIMSPSAFGAASAVPRQGNTWMRNR
jgi:uncharacterized membrane protein YjjP (DUF1212 family)